FVFCFDSSSFSFVSSVVSSHLSLLSFPVFSFYDTPPPPLSPPSLPDALHILWERLRTYLKKLIPSCPYTFGYRLTQDYHNTGVWLFDCGEGTQHQMLNTADRKAHV
ncbi:hypothetical protein, partial [Salmonella enterica]|uniref:hypothetical protein n=1 Tax=Salmonella enterica TaxID=28901 RepID=UPI001ADAAF9D